MLRTPTLLIEDYRDAAIGRLLDRAQEITENHWGIPVHLLLSKTKSTPKLTTTAEAICALAPFNKERTDKYEYLISGLDELKARSKELSIRKLAWYALAMVASAHDERAARALEDLIGRQSEQNGSWPDDEKRAHEVYATWIATWAVLKGREFFRSRRPVKKDLIAQLSKAIQLGTSFLMDAFVDTGLPAGQYGACFTMQPAVRPDETLPNPAMTAYLLSLLAELDNAEMPESFRPKAMGAFAYFESLERDYVWDSVREPFREDSPEGDFEHFTTCWVARAYWKGAIKWGGTDVDGAGKLPLLIGFARAMRGLSRELGVANGYEGYIFIDRGAPIDYSFALSDYLLLLNELSDHAETIEQSLEVYMARILTAVETQSGIAELQHLVDLGVQVKEHQETLDLLHQKIKANARTLAQQKRAKEILDHQISETTATAAALNDEAKAAGEALADNYSHFRKLMGPDVVLMAHTAIDLGYAAVCAAAILVVLFVPHGSPWFFSSAVVGGVVAGYLLIIGLYELAKAYRATRVGWLHCLVPILITVIGVSLAVEAYRNPPHEGEPLGLVKIILMVVAGLGAGEGVRESIKKHQRIWGKHVSPHD